MKGCHNCPVEDEIARGLYKNVAWGDVPCATCKVTERAGFSLEFDEGRLSDDKNESASCEPELYDHTVMPMDVMRDCVVGLLTLPADLRDVVAWRFGGMSYQEIAATQGVTMAAVEKRHRRAMKLWPGLEALFVEKKVKQKRRKKHAKHQA